MKRDKRISLVSVIIAILLMAILVVLIWIGMAVINSVEDGKNEDTGSKIAVNNDNDKEKRLSSMNLDELVYDAEYDKMSDARTYKVYTLVNKNGTWEYDDNPITVRLSDVQYPYINIDSADAAKANKEIKELYMDYEKTYKDMEGFCKDDGALYVGDYYGNAIIDWDVYSTFKHESILSVFVKESAHFNNEIFDYTTWTFNLNTKELMSFEEICDELGYNASEVRQEVKVQVQNKLKEYEEEFDFDVDKALEETMNRYDDNTKKYFVDNTGNLNVIVDTEVPFEREHYEFIYTII